MVNLGPTPAFLSIPVGGTADLVGARNYFSTDRGQQTHDRAHHGAAEPIRGGFTNTSKHFVQRV